MSPATYTAEHLRSRAERRMVDFDPDSADIALVDLDPDSSAECLPLSDGYRRFLAGIMHTIGTTDIDAFQIIAATDADGTGATVVVQHSNPDAADAVGDYIWLECDIEQVKEVLAGATHIGVRAEFETLGDEAVVYFERADPQFAYTGLTADRIS